jgi:hypothetical protein
MGRTQWAVPSDGVAFAAVLKYDMRSGSVVDSWRPDDGERPTTRPLLPPAGRPRSSAKKAEIMMCEFTYKTNYSRSTEKIKNLPPKWKMFYRRNSKYL